MRTRLMLSMLMAVGLAGAITAIPTSASQISGAIFTTNATDSEVNVNQYASKSDVYLNGGPGVGAPLDAAGLPPGVYVFQVTDPSGKTLLSTDAAKCRQFTVGSGGFITDVNPSIAAGCAHVTGTDSVTGGKTVQLVPFNNTPNNGGVYKAWATPVVDYICPLTVVDCGFTAGSNVHGFVPSFSKTDNFKVKVEPIREIDTQFHSNASGAQLLGMGETWTDTLGASNGKWSYNNPSVNVNFQAHIEAIEPGTHSVTIANQPGCTISEIDTNFPNQNTVIVSHGPATVSATIPKNGSQGALTWYIDVYCN
jgi:hypothetical protein